MRDVYVVGVGMHPYGKFPDKLVAELSAVAVESALKDAGLKWRDIQSAVSGTWPWGMNDGLNTGCRTAALLGETGIPICHVTNMCATGGSALREAYMQVASGAYDVVIAMGQDKAPPGFFSVGGKEQPERYPDILKDTDWVRWRMMGLSNPACWAIDCRRRMEKYGTTEVHLAKAKVACSKHGALNPDARYRKVFTVEEVLNSAMVCDPLRLYMICATRDGAAAAILCSAEKTRQLTTKLIKVTGTSLGSALYGDPTLRLGITYTPVTEDVPLVSESYSSAQKAYAMAGLGPEDLDFAEIPDNSSWHYLQYIETIGLCEAGGADHMLDEDAFQLGGKIPVCPSGGIASSGEVVSAMGLWQIREVVIQLRGEGGDRQVEGAKVGLAQTYGQMGNSACTILTR